MRIFNPTEREYVNPISLEQLDKSVTQLEQGHKEAVKTASDLQVAMANLDINEAHDGWKQDRIAEIKQTIADNTQFGNSYGALDDIVKKAGDLASDPAMIGRLKAQKDFKEYQANLDTRNDVPEAYKDMFRERNKYYYEDKVDESGKVVGGSKWEPQSRPVQSVDFFKVMQQGLSIASANEGGSNRVTFLDANGQPTTDPSKSVNGAMYDNTSQQYKILSEDKIRNGIKAALASTPGALASLEQDYDFAKWNYDKEVKNNKGKPIVQEGVTDKSGNILTFDNFMEYKMNNFADSAKYANVHTSVQLGTALQLDRAAKAEANAKNAATAATDYRTAMANSVKSGATTIGTVETKVDNYSTNVNNRQKAEGSALGLISQYSPKIGKGLTTVSDFIQTYKRQGRANGPGSAVNAYIQDMQNSGVVMKAEDKVRLRNAVMGSYQYNETIKGMESKLKGTEQDALKFSSSVFNNKYQAGNSQYDDAIIKYNNNIWQNNDEVRIQMNSKGIEELNKTLGVRSLADLGLTTTNVDGDTVVSIRANNRDIIPKLMSAIKKADNARGITGRSLKNMFSSGTASFSDYDISSYKNGEQTNYTSDGRLTSVAMNNMATWYDKGIAKGASAQKSAGVNRGILSVESTNKESWRGAEVQWLYNNGIIDAPTYNAQSKMAKENLDNSFASASFDAGMLYSADESNAFEKVDKPYDMQALISYMYSNHGDKVNRSAMALSGVPDAVKGGNAPMSGYVLTFTVPDNAVGAGKEFKGKSFKMMYTGNISEDVGEDPAMSISHVSNSLYNAAQATKGPAQVLEYNNNLGNTNVESLGSGKWKVNFAGSDNITSDQGSLAYIKNVTMLERLKGNLQMGAIRDPKIIEQNVNTIAKDISAVTGKDIGIVQQTIINYLQN